MRHVFCIFLIGLLILTAVCGCVRRKMTVHSNPPGAAVYLDGKEIGRTPFSTNFDHYGKREFRIVKQGYETKTVNLPVSPPWYQWVGLDFISEVLVPGKLTDQKFYEFDLQQDKTVPGAEIVARAEELRHTAHSDGIPRIGSPAAAPPVPSPAAEAGSITPPPGPFAPIQ
ncbi:MAG: PEGA domain-containing protein [Planctomycetaceae bacterium]|jgi:hypothetical protein|nr:PEGA domain-containing protein [Planctomycetaceae bacterium]